MDQGLNSTVSTSEAQNRDLAAEAQMDGTEEHSVALRMPVALGVVSGDINAARDIRLPRLELVQGTSRIVAMFPQGSFVLGQQSLVAEKDKEMRIIILSAFQYWKEWLPKELASTGVTPRSYKTLQEAKADHLTDAWDNTVVPPVAPTVSLAMDMNVLIEKPDGLVCSQFCIDLAGKSYAAARWSVDKMAYRRCASTVLTAAAGVLKKPGLESGIWSLKGIVEVKPGKVFASPILRYIGENSTALVTEIRAQLGAVKMDAAPETAGEPMPF